MFLKDKQYIHDLWIENSIPSVNFRNGRDSVKMSYDKYEHRYANLNNDKHPVQQKVKRGVKVYVASRRVTICTIRKLRSKIMSEKGINISIGLLSYLKPFYITNPTNKEKVMCMCKLCLNFRLKFNALMNHSKNFNGPHFHSIFSYYMSSCKCSKGENGYWALKCVEGKCKNCCNIKQPEILNLKYEVLHYNEFVVKNVSYVNKKTKEIKESKQTVRETVEKDVKNVHDELLIESRKYLKRKFQIENERYQWRIILNRNLETIFHMDFSENVSGSPKYKPQDAHPESNTYL